MITPPIVGGYEWQTIALFAGAALAVVVLFLYAHFAKTKGTAGVCLWDLIKDEGAISGRKTIELGGFLVMSGVVIVETIRGSPSVELILGFGTICIASRVAGQVVNLKNKRLELDNESQEIWDVASNSPEREPARKRAAARSKVSSE